MVNNWYSFNTGVEASRRFLCHSSPDAITEFKIQTRPTMPDTARSWPPT